MTNKDFYLEIDCELNKFREEAYNEGYADANKHKSFDPIGMKEICFSFADSLGCDDKRLEKFKEQRLKRGWDDTELWCLDATILKFILPRLKEFKDVHCGYPAFMETDKKWAETLQKMVDSIESILNEDIPESEKDYSGWELFKEHFFSLWD